MSSNKKGGNKEKKITAQQSIPYREMGKDGICRVEDGYYSKTIRFYDINYQLAQNEDKNAIFENWCDFLNYFDRSEYVKIAEKMKPYVKNNSAISMMFEEGNRLRAIYGAN